MAFGRLCVLLGCLFLPGIKVCINSIPLHEVNYVSCYLYNQLTLISLYNTHNEKKEEYNINIFKEDGRRRFIYVGRFV